MEPDPVILGKAAELLVLKYARHKTEGWLRFMRDELKYTPDKCVEPVIVDLSQYFDTSTRSSHGVGKTACGATVLLTAMAMVPNLVTLQVSPTWTQVVEIFWNEVRRWYGNSRILPILFDMAEKAPRMTSRLSPETWYARGVSSSKSGNVEGRHGCNFFLVVDEAKAVDDSIIEGVQGALTSEGENVKVWRGYFSTPTTPGGKHTAFYKTFTKLRHRWKNHKITAHDSPRVSRRWVDQMIEEFGIESQIVQARVFAEFPEAGSDILISLQDAESFYDPEIVAPTGGIAIGVDVARFGQDESVISFYRGSVLQALHPFHKRDTVAVAGHVIETIEEMTTLNDQIVIGVDDIGVGGGVTDQLVSHYERRKTVQIVPFVANATPENPNTFKDLMSETAWNFAKALRAKHVSSLVRDDTLEGQLSGFKKEFMKDRIKVYWPETKAEGRITEEKSPDRAMSVFIGWYASKLVNVVMADRETKSATDKRLAEIEKELEPISRDMRTRNF